MRSSSDRTPPGVARREFLRFVAGSPLALSGAVAASVEALLAAAARGEEGPRRPT